MIYISSKCNKLFMIPLYFLRMWQNCISVLWRNYKKTVKGLLTLQLKILSWYIWSNLFSLLVVGPIWPRMWRCDLFGCRKQHQGVLIHLELLAEGFFSLQMYLFWVFVACRPMSRMFFPPSISGYPVLIIEPTSFTLLMLIEIDWFLHLISKKFISR